jgi:hypothetical protein
VRGSSCSCELFSGNSFDRFDSYRLQTLALQMLLQRTNHLFEKMMKGSVLHIAHPTARFVGWSKAPYDAAAKGAEGETEVFGQQFIGDASRATTWPPQRFRRQTSCSCYSRTGSALCLGFKPNASSAEDILNVGAQPAPTLAGSRTRSANGPRAESAWIGIARDSLRSGRARL